MSTSHKIQIAFILVILSLATFVYFRSRTQTFDDSITCNISTRKHGVDPTKPIVTVNPEDPNKLELVHIFSCVDGRLEISEFPKDASRHPSIVFKPETKGGPRTYFYYQDPLSPIAKIKDPFKHALAFATYHQVYVKALGLLGSTGLTADQLTQEAATRKILEDTVAIISNAVDSGTFHLDMVDSVMKAVAAYDAKTGDALKDSKKMDLGRKVVELSAAYLKRIQQEKDDAIDAYMKAMAGIMDASQQAKLITAVANYQQQQAASKNPNAKNAQHAPAPNTTTPNRGNRGATPNRGAPARGTPAPGGNG